MILSLLPGLSLIRERDVGLADVDGTRILLQFGAIGQNHSAVNRRALRSS